MTDSGQQASIMHEPFPPGTVAVITGAAGGLGRALASAFAETGCDVLAVDLDREGLDRLAAEYPRVQPLVLDVTAPGAPTKVAATAAETLGGLHVLVNNAGITSHGPAIDYSAREWDRIMSVNLRAPFLLSQAAARVMSDGGSIVNVGSIGGRTANPGNVPYGVSKTALLGLTMHLALEWGPLGIRVNAVNPGMTTSTMSDLLVSGEVKRAQAAMLPLRRLPEPADIADAVTFLASERARAITGAVLDVDAGYLLSLMSTVPRGEMRTAPLSGTRLRVLRTV
jgi:NAD(P)-dependent dehydrogenase (short-subunit alcohol dehydrogenase family)